MRERESGQDRGIHKNDKLVLVTAALHKCGASQSTIGKAEHRQEGADCIRLLPIPA